MGALAVAGCLSNDDDGVDPGDLEPVALTDAQACDVCGMVIEDHFGPNGQIFYAGDRPEGRDGPAWFDSITELVAFHEEHEARGWDVLAFFVTDYSAVAYELETVEGTVYISTHPEAEAFADATELSYVVDSEVEGAMGRDLLPFSDADEASSFAADHGGTVQSWAEVGP